jgi:hypothetical protein
MVFFSFSISGSAVCSVGRCRARARAGPRSTLAPWRDRLLVRVYALDAILKTNEHPSSFPFPNPPSRASNIYLA